MNSPTRYCARCAQPLTPGATFCTHCGTPVAPAAPYPPTAPPASPLPQSPYNSAPPPPQSPYISAAPPPQSPYPSPQPSYSPASPQQPPPAAFPPPEANKSGRSWLGLGMVISGGLCLLLVVVGGLVYASGLLSGTPAKPAASSIQVTSAAPLPATVTSQPATKLPTATTLPPTATTAPTTAPVSPSNGSSTQFSDDFSNPNSGWAVGTTDNYTMDYFPGGRYMIGEKQPNKYAYSIPPYLLTRPIRNVNISVRGKTSSPGAGFFGVMCNWVDNNNFYQTLISNNKFAIGKLINGKWTDLTEGGWSDLISATPDAEGYHLVEMSCFDGFIVLQVDGMGQAHLVDNDLTSGDVALFAQAGDKPGEAGYYVQAFFKDFSVSLR